MPLVQVLFYKSVRRAFTLVEILATVAIIAVLVVGATFFTVGYVDWAKDTANKQTLLVLNDALSRYKTQGGSVTSLTAGAPIPNVLARLATTLSWGGTTHYLLKKNQTFQARSLYASGSGHQYHFTRYDTYTAESGGSSPALQPAISLSSIDALNSTDFFDGPTWTIPDDMPVTATLVITNTGQAPLTVTSISYPSAVFSGSYTGTIAAGASQNVTVSFSDVPPGGSYSGTIIVSSDAASGTNTIAISATSDT